MSISPIFFNPTHNLKRKKRNGTVPRLCYVRLLVLWIGLHVSVTGSVAVVVNFVFLKLEFYTYLETVQLREVTDAEPVLFCSRESLGGEVLGQHLANKPSCLQHCAPYTSMVQRWEIFIWKKRQLIWGTTRRPLFPLLVLDTLQTLGFSHAWVWP